MRRRLIELPGFELLAFLAVIAFVFMLVLLRFAVLAMDPRIGPPDRLEIVADQADRYFPPRPGIVIRGDRPTAEELERRYGILARELSRYPSELVTLMRLRLIVLCSRLTLNGVPKGGLTYGPVGTIVLDVAPFEPYDEDAFRTAIHHELFHVIDTMLTRTDGLEDAWKRMNPPGFEYGGEEIEEALAITGVNPEERSETPGLLNHYAMVSGVEDRAVLFSAMMVFPDELRIVAGGDPLLGEKLRYLDRALRTLSPAFGALLK